MGISDYLKDEGESKEAFAARLGIPLSTLYRWLDEEEKTGVVRSINGGNLAKLAEGSKGKITANAVIGVKTAKAAKKRTRRAA